MNKGKQNRSNFALSETKHSEESTTATSRMHARTHIRTESGVQHAGLYRGGVRLPKLEGKVERGCAREDARARVQLNGALNALPSVSKREQCRPRIHAYSALTPVTGRRMKAVLSAADGPTGEER